MRKKWLSIIVMFFLSATLLFAVKVENADEGGKEAAEKDDKIVTIQEHTENVVPFDRKGVVSLALSDADVATVMKGISQLGNYDFVTKGEIAKTVNLTLKGRSIREALDIISDSTGVEYRLDGTIITVFGEGVDPAYTDTYSVEKGNTLVIGKVLQDLIGGTRSTQGATDENSSEGGEKKGSGGAGSGPAEISKGHSRIVVDKLNGQVIITAVPSDHRKVQKVWKVIDADKPSKRYTTRMFELKFISTSVFASSIKFLVPGIEEGQIFTMGGDEKAGPVASTSKRVIIQETIENLDRIEKLLKTLDVPPRQVVIDVKMVEFTLSRDEKLGVDWRSIFTESGRDLPVGEFLSPLSSAGTGRLKFGSLGPDHVQIILDFIQTSSNANVLSNPQVTALDGVTAKITVSDKIPYRTSTVTNGIVVGEVKEKDAGVVLNVTPVIFKNEFVNLTIEPKITSRNGDFDNIPIISTKELSTTLNIKNNHTVVMGGLIVHEQSHETNHIPFLGKVPGIGKLFQSNGTNHKSSELVFLITPRIYSEFEMHPHDKLKLRFDDSEEISPTTHNFVTKEQQQKEYSEFVKRSKL